MYKSYKLIKLLSVHPSTRHGGCPGDVRGVDVHGGGGGLRLMGRIPSRDNALACELGMVCGVRFPLGVDEFLVLSLQKD